MKKQTNKSKKTTGALKLARAIVIMGKISRPRVRQQKAMRSLADRCVAVMDRRTQRLLGICGCEFCLIMPKPDSEFKASLHDIVIHRLPTSMSLFYATKLRSFKKTHNNQGSQ